MMRKMKQPNYLRSGVYSISEAAKLIDAPRQRLRRWIHGDAHGYNVVPLIKNELPDIDGHIAMSFINLIEALFISRFVQEGVHVRSIRAMAEEAKNFLDNDHPFATNILFKTDGRDIFAEVARKTRDKKLYSLRKHNWALEPIIGPSLKAAVTYGPNRLAHSWYPNKQQAPHVVVNPSVSFGQPVLADTGIPTRTLYNSYVAEGRKADIVAHWYEVDKRKVMEAVRFEENLARVA